MNSPLMLKWPLQGMWNCHPVSHSLDNHFTRPPIIIFFSIFGFKSHLNIRVFTKTSLSLQIVLILLFWNYWKVKNVKCRLQFESKWYLRLKISKFFFTIKLNFLTWSRGWHMIKWKALSFGISVTPTDSPSSQKN